MISNKLLLATILSLSFFWSCTSNKTTTTAENPEEQNVISDEDEKVSGDFSDIEKLCKDQDVVKGLKIANQKYQDNKTNASYWNLIGSCFLKDIRPLKARLFFLRALEENKNYAPALNNLGMVYWYLDKHYDALSYFKRAIQANPSSNITKYNLGRLYLWYGVHKSSAAYLSLDNEMGNKKHMSSYVATNETMLGDYQNAVIHFKQAKVSDSTQQGLYAIALKNAGMNEAAQEEWQDAKLSSSHPLQWMWISGDQK